MKSDRAAALPTAGAASIDIVIPVYNAPGDVARCVESVLAHSTAPYRLILIDDASPDPQVARVLADIAARGADHVHVLRNRVNLGFTGTANRGMHLSRADVVLLNSDTVVTHDWLDALRRCAAANPSFGTITPFSNNAEICSFPQFCRDNPWPDGADPEPVRAALARAAAPTYPDLPTGVGFCMYVRRTLLDAIGGFDPAFGAGYGEENDFCLRGFAVGYRNVLCDDAFVLHVGGRSFEDRKTELGRRNLGVLLARHPHYERMVAQYVGADPLRPIRESALSQARAHESSLPGVLHILHPQGGGTEQHARGLIAASQNHFRHYLLVAGAQRWQLEEHLDGGAIRTFAFERVAAPDWTRLLEGLCATFGIALVHVHHISGCREGLLQALSALDRPVGYTVHDLNWACPTTTFLLPDGTYCGGQTRVETCATCVANEPGLPDVDVALWRKRHGELLRRAAFILAPSSWAAAQLTSYFPDLQIEIVPHGSAAATAARSSSSGNVREPPAVLALPDDGVPTVAVVGAIGPDKGARRLERVVDLARAQQAPVRFVVIGYLDRERGPWQSDDARLTVHGPYEPKDLPALLDHYRVALVMYPSAGPESFSFTLSETWSAGRPVLVPPIGALAERVESAGAGWLWTHAQWRSEAQMLSAVLDRVRPDARTGLAQAAQRACGVVQTTIEAMAARIEQVYRRALSRAPHVAELAPLDARAVRDALGYRLWYPPEGEALAALLGGSAGRPEATAAVRLRRAGGRVRRRLANLVRKIGSSAARLR